MRCKTLFKYLSKEILLTTVAVTTIVVFIFICNQFVRYLGYVASGKFAIGTLFHLIFLQVPILFGYLLPLGLFLGILLGLGRLYAESEMTVMMACGFSREQLIAMVFGIAVFIMLVVSFLVFWVSPYVALQRDKMIDLADASTVFETILPGRFQVSKDGQRVFYVGSMSRDRHHVRQIFVAQQSEKKANAKKQKPWMIISASKGKQFHDSKTKANYIVVESGYRYDGVPGQKDFQITKFGQYGIQLQMAPAAMRHEGTEVIPTLKLIPLAFVKPVYMAELQWRLSLPLSVLILTLIAVPLSQVRPRQGRFAKLAPTIFIYLIYVNMIFVSRSWIEDEKISSIVGVWWIHLVMLILGLYLLHRFLERRYKKRI